MENIMNFEQGLPLKKIFREKEKNCMNKPMTLIL